MAYRGQSPALPQLESVRRLREAGVKGMKWGVRSGKKEPVNKTAHEGLAKYGFKLVKSGQTSSGKGAYSEYSHEDGHRARVQKSSTENRVTVWDKDGRWVEAGGTEGTPQRAARELDSRGYKIKGY